MSLRKIVIAAALVLSVSVAAPAKASADWLFTPFIGGTFGGSANVGNTSEDLEDKYERQLNYGASLAWMGAGVVGFEVDFGYSPNFFNVSPDNGTFNFVGAGNVTTLMGNVVVGAPLGGVRPYAAGGIGLLRSRARDVANFLGDATSNDLGIDVGGGLMVLPAENVGIRADLRYFRSLNDVDPNGVDLQLGSFKFWRGTVGVTFKF